MVTWNLEVLWPELSNILWGVLLNISLGGILAEGVYLEGPEGCRTLRLEN